MKDAVNTIMEPKEFLHELDLFLLWNIVHEEEYQFIVKKSGEDYLFEVPLYRTNISALECLLRLKRKFNFNISNITYNPYGDKNIDLEQIKKAILYDNKILNIFTKIKNNQADENDLAELVENNNRDLSQTVANCLVYEFDISNNNKKEINKRIDSHLDEMLKGTFDHIVNIKQNYPTSFKMMLQTFKESFVDNEEENILELNKNDSPFSIWFNHIVFCLEKLKAIHITKIEAGIEYSSSYPTHFDYCFTVSKNLTEIEIPHEKINKENTDKIICELKNGKLIINTETGEIILNKVKTDLNLGSKEYLTLFNIANNKNYQAKYSELIKDGDSKTSRRNLSFVIRNIKKVLGILPVQKSKNKDIFKNIKKYGYKLLK